MHATVPMPRPVSRRVRSALLMVAGALAFLGIASVVNPNGPRSASAGSAGGGFAATQVLADTHPTRGWKLIGSLISNEHEARMWATPDGPRYSIHTLDGRLLQDNLAADDVYRAFPDMDIERLRADPPNQRTLMLADPPQD